MPSPALLFLLASPDLAVTAEIVPAEGWMEDGWGTLRLGAQNGETPLRLKRITARWYAKGQPVGEGWEYGFDRDLPAGAEATREEASYLPGDVVRRAAPEPPEIRGEAETDAGNVPYSVRVPVARLPEPLRTIKGRYVHLSVMRSRYAKFKTLDRTLRWMDQAYARMIHLTGETPFEGRPMILLEAPEHPWWAYAGERMILNTKFVPGTLAEFDAGQLSFGWVHEVGHNFDVLGPWYIWDGPSAEWQANWKLAYALETLPDQSFRMPWNWQAKGYPAPPAKPLLTGRELVERFFLPFGDAYLADPERPWTSMASDDIHSFHQRIQRTYGWEPYRRWYRAYREMANRGLKSPVRAEDKIALTAAILSRETGVDLVPLFVRWRFPVTPESVQKIAETYGVKRP